MIGLLLLGWAEIHYQKRDIDRNNINILNGFYPMFSQVGIVDAVHHELHGLGGKEGYVAYGPYMTLKPGKYKVTYTIFLDHLPPGAGPDDSVGNCDINVEGHPERNKKIELKLRNFGKGKEQKFKLGFSVPIGEPKLEFRVYQYNGVSLSLTGLRVKPEVKTAIFNWNSKWVKFNLIFFGGLALVLLVKFFGKRFFRSKYKSKIIVFLVSMLIMEMWWFHRELLFYVWPGPNIFTQVGVKDEEAKEIKGVGGQNGFLVYGPYSPLQEGAYLAVFEIKLNNPRENDDEERAVGVCDINIINFGENNVSNPIKIKEFNKHGWVKKTLAFKIPQDGTNVEYRVFQYGGNELTVKTIKAHRNDYVRKFYKLQLDFIGIALLTALAF
jgi:hypothetical protein